MSILLEAQRIFLAIIQGLIAIGFFSVYWQLRNSRDSLIILSRRTALAGALFVGWSAVLNVTVLYFGLDNEAYVLVATTARVVVTVYAGWVALCAAKSYWQASGKHEIRETDSEHNQTS